jgi:hypothetical protein
MPSSFAASRAPTASGSGCSLPGVIAQPSLPTRPAGSRPPASPSVPPAASARAGRVSPAGASARRRSVCTRAARCIPAVRLVGGLRRHVTILPQAAGRQRGENEVTMPGSARRELPACPLRVVCRLRAEMPRVTPRLGASRRCGPRPSSSTRCLLPRSVFLPPVLATRCYGMSSASRKPANRGARREKSVNAPARARPTRYRSYLRRAQQASCQGAPGSTCATPESGQSPATRLGPSIALCAALQAAQEKGMKLTRAKHYGVPTAQRNPTL